DAATGDFVLWLDADDLVENADRLPDLAFKMEAEKLPCVWLPLDYERAQSGRVQGELWRDRIVRRGASRWVGPIHEVLVPAHLSAPRLTTVRVSQRARSGRANETRVAHRNLKVLLHEKRRLGDAVEPRTLFYLANEARGA